MGFWLYFFQKPPTMATSSFYPFGGSSEIARLSILSEAILCFWKIRAFRILGKPEAEIVTALGEYDKEWQEKKKLLEERPDIAASGKTKYQGTIIR